MWWGRKLGEKEKEEREGKRKKITMKMYLISNDCLLTNA